MTTTMRISDWENGRLYLFEGSKEDCLVAFQKDFAQP